MNLIIVNGQTSTGKTTLAKRLVGDLHIPAFMKDVHKEAIFDSFDTKIPLKQWVRAEASTWHLLYKAVEEAVQKNSDLIIEGNFTGTQKRHLSSIMASRTNVIEVFMYGTGFSVFKRYVVRNQTKERHPGHRDHLWYWLVWLEAGCGRLGWRWIKPMRLGRQVLTLDTTNFNQVDYSDILRFVRQSMI